MLRRETLATDDRLKHIPSGWLNLTFTQTQSTLVARVAALVERLLNIQFAQWHFPLGCLSARFERSDCDEIDAAI